MPRVFGCVVIAHAILMIATAVLGFASVGVHTHRHIVLAVFTLMLGCLLQILGFMYLAVTGKMMRQAIHLGRLSVAPLVELHRQKRNATIVLAFFMISVVFVVATGATHWRDGRSGMLHLLAAVMAWLVQLLCGMVGFLCVARHRVVFAGTMREYADRKIEARLA